MSILKGSEEEGRAKKNARPQAQWAQGRACFLTSSGGLGVPGEGQAVGEVVAVATDTGVVAVPALVVDDFTRREGVAISLTMGADLD